MNPVHRLQGSTSQSLGLGGTSPRVEGPPTIVVCVAADGGFVNDFALAWNDSSGRRSRRRCVVPRFTEFSRFTFAGPLINDGPAPTDEVFAMMIEMHPALEARLSGIESLLCQIQGFLAAPKVTRDWYTVEEAATILKKSTYTVREWCREGRINAKKRAERRGGTELWNISASEIERIRNEGFLTPDSWRNSGK